MNLKSHTIFPLKRIAATIYDLFLLLGVWFGVGSIALWMNNGEILNPWLGLSIVFISTWAFYSYFWTHGNKTLGMAIWKVEIYSFDGNEVNLQQTSIRFIANLVIFSLGGLPLIQIYFSKNGHSISDVLSKTGLRPI
ncbi:RDD family protein [Gammaproteobacteria bacterium]|jgi:uncharacterized RDD family membrane protein YckC|nr:RDD family protein [Gammaproteobacteria bacterium]